MELLKNFANQTFSSFKIRNYRLYFTGQGISVCGTWMQTVGQAWLVLKLSNSGTQLGLVLAAQFLPILIFGPWGGVIADRFPKRKILYLTQSASGLLALTLGILVATQSIQLWMVYILALGLGLINAIDTPTRQTFVTEMVGKEQVTNAVSLNAVMFNLARLIGPAIAAALIANVGLAACFFLNALSYVAVLLSLQLIPGHQLQTVAPIQRARGQLMEGFRYIRSTPELRNILIMMAIIGTLCYEFSVSLPLFAKFTFHGNAATYAALTGSMGVGSVLGGLFVAAGGSRHSRNLILSAFIFGLSIVIVAIMPSQWSAMLVLVAVGALSTHFTSQGNATLQLESAPSMRGRVLALWNVAFVGTTPIGGPIIGFISEYLNPRWGLALGGIAAILAAGIGAIAIRKSKS